MRSGAAAARRRPTVAWIELPSYPLGARERCTAPQRQIRLAPGDVLVLTTDGLTEVRDPTGRILGYEGLAALWPNAAGIPIRAA